MISIYQKENRLSNEIKIEESKESTMIENKQNQGLEMETGFH